MKNSTRIPCATPPLFLGEGQGVRFNLNTMNQHITLKTARLGTWVRGFITLVVLPVLLCTNTNYLSAATVASMNSGDWDDLGFGTTWDCGCLPGTADCVTILSTHTVTLTANVTVLSFTNLGTLIPGIFSVTVFAPSPITSMGSGGSFNNPATWDCVCVPTYTNTIMVSANSTVTLGANTTVAGATILAAGVLDNAGNTLTFGTTTGNCLPTQVVINGTYTGGGPTNISGSGSDSITITGTGTVATNGLWTFSASVIETIDAGANLTFSGSSGITIAKGPLHYFGTVVLASGDFTVLNGAGTPFFSGTLVLTSGNFIVYSPVSPVIRPTGILTLTSGDINLISSPGLVRMTNAGSVTVGGDITGTSNGCRFTNTGTLNIAGTLLLGWGTLYNYSGNTVNYNGTGAQAIKRPSQLAGSLAADTYYHLQCSNANTKTLAANTTIMGNLTLQDAAALDVSPSSYHIDIKGNWYDSSVVSDPFLERTGTVTFSGDSAQLIIADSVKKETFYNLVLNDIGTVDDDLNVVTLHDSITVLNTFTLSDGVLNLNKNVLTLANKADTALTGGSDTAYILSEDENGNNQSRVQWNVQDTTGTYIIPFGINEGGTDYYIPFAFNIATKGFETTTGTGNISISTYSTPTANTPYPVSPDSVTQVYNPANAVDRFWQIDAQGYNDNPTADLTFTYPDPEKPLAGDTLVAQRWNSNTLLWDAPQGGQTFSASSALSTGTVTIAGINNFSPWTLAKKNDYLKCPEILKSANSTICYGDTIILSTLTSPAGFYTQTWSPSAGLTASTGEQTNASPETGGTTYTISGNDGAGCYNNQTVNIEVNPLPTLTGTANTELCYGNDTTLSVSGGVTYTWSPATYLNSASTGSVIFSLAPVGSISYTVTGYNQYNCISTHTFSVTVLQLPIVNAGSDQFICLNDSATLTAIGTTGNYSWTPGAYFSTNSGAVVTAGFPAVADTYSCAVFLMDNNSCSAGDTVLINVVAELIANAGQDITISCGTNTTLSGSGGLTFSWSPASGLSSTNTTSTNFDLLVPGVYSYSLVVASGIGCVSAPNEVIITVDSLTANAGLDLSICSGSSANLIGSGGVTYVWVPETGLSSTNTNNTSFNLSESGVYSYSLTVSSGIGCVSAPDEVTISVIAIPTVYAGANITIRPNMGDTIIASGNALNYTWNPSICSNCLNIEVHPTSTTQYIITASNGNCTVSDTVTAFFVPYQCEVFVPNAFSPDDDGINDSVGVRSYCIRPEGFAFRIFDRWGTMVFQTYTQDKSWDGKYENQDIASGTVFVYTINGTNINNDAINEKGNITLVR